MAAWHKGGVGRAPLAPASHPTGLSPHLLPPLGERPAPRRGTLLVIAVHLRSLMLLSPPLLLPLLAALVLIVAPLCLLFRSPPAGSSPPCAGLIVMVYSQLDGS